MIKKGWRTATLLPSAALAVIVVALYMHRDLPAAAVEAEYARPPSQFMMVDGVRMHYRDEGHGPAIVLIHGQFDSLLMWEPWANALKSRYRVIRFDLTSHGLSAPDASGDYSLERTVALMERFTDQLHLGKFALAGSSIGGTVAVYYAARHPERVDRLILVSPQGMGERLRSTHATIADTSLFVDALAYVAPRLFAEGLLRNGFGDPSRVPDALVDEHCMLLRKAGNRPGELARIRQFEPIDIDAHLRALRSPVLLMWGEQSGRAISPESEILRRAFRNAHSLRIEVIRGAGDMTVQEDPEGTAIRAREFMDAGHGEALPKPERRARDPRFNDGYELPMESVYVTRAA